MGFILFSKIGMFAYNHKKKEERYHYYQISTLTLWIPIFRYVPVREYQYGAFRLTLDVPVRPMALFSTLTLDVPVRPMALFSTLTLDVPVRPMDTKGLTSNTIFWNIG